MTQGQVCVEAITDAFRFAVPPCQAEPAGDELAHPPAGEWEQSPFSA